MNLSKSLLYYGQNPSNSHAGCTHMNRRHFPFIIILTCAALTSGLAQPKIQVVGGTKIDLGSIYRGAVVERKVMLKNIGSDTLVVSRVDPSCGCTGTVVSNDHIETIASAAREHGTEAVAGEIIGFIPRRAYEMAPKFFRHAESFSESRILETRIAELLG